MYHGHNTMHTHLVTNCMHSTTLIVVLRARRVLNSTRVLLPVLVIASLVLRRIHSMHTSK